MVTAVSTIGGWAIGDHTKDKLGWPLKAWAIAKASCGKHRRGGN